MQEDPDELLQILQELNKCLNTKNKFVIISGTPQTQSGLPRTPEKIGLPDVTRESPRTVSNKSEILSLAAANYSTDRSNNIQIQHRESATRWRMIRYVLRLHWGSYVDLDCEDFQ